MSSKRWKKNSLLSNFLKNKPKRRSNGPYQKKCRPTFSLSSSRSTVNPEYSLHVDEPLEQDMGDGYEPSDEGEYSTTGAGASAGRCKACRTYQKTHTRELESWKAIQPSLLQIYTSSLVLPPGQVCMTLSCRNPAKFRCRDCSSLAYYCEDCCRSCHRYNNFLHIPEVWAQGEYILSPLDHVTVPLTHQCATAYKEKVTVVSIKGQHHGIYVVFCGCLSISERLFSVGLWPATPTKPTLAFTLELMHLVHGLVLECQASLYDICNFLKMAGVKQAKDRKFYKQLIASFPQYRYYKECIKCSVHLDHHECPACPKVMSPDPAFVSIDANFRLCRRAKAGHTSKGDSPLIQTFFLSQDIVDNYVGSEQRIATFNTQTNCSEFKAGDALRSRSRYQALDETAVLGAICRHDFPIRMLSLKHGERLAYADILLSTMVNQSLLPCTFNLLYDIGCKLESHWKANCDKHRILLRTCRIAIPIFHAYAHIAACQHKYNPRNLAGFGLVDGENVERLWSFLGRFSRMTKEMSAANRVDVLSDALSHYCTLKEEKLDSACIERFSNACKQSTIVEKEIGTILSTSRLSMEQLPSLRSVLMSDEQKRLERTENLAHSSSWRVEYVKLLTSMEDLRNKWTKVLQQLSSNVSTQVISETIQHLSSLEHKIQRFEQINRIEKRWEPSMEEYQEAQKIVTMGQQQKIKGQILEVVKERVFYLNTLAHHAGGQKQASRVSTLIQSCTSKVKTLLAQFQQLQSDEVSHVSVKEVCNLHSSFWISDHSYCLLEPHDKLPASAQRRLLELCHLQERTAEEKQQAIADLILMVQFYNNRLDHCTASIFEYLHEHSENDFTIIHQPNFHLLYATYASLIDSLPIQVAGAVAALLRSCHLFSLKIQKLEQITNALVQSYWANEDDVQVNVKYAKHICASVKVLPRSYSLYIIDAPSSCCTSEDGQLQYCDDSNDSDSSNSSHIPALDSDYEGNASDLCSDDDSSCSMTM